VRLVLTHMVSYSLPLFFFFSIFSPSLLDVALLTPFRPECSQTPSHRDMAAAVCSALRCSEFVRSQTGAPGSAAAPAASAK